MSLICQDCHKIIVMSYNPNHYGLCASCGNDRHAKPSTPKKGLTKDELISWLISKGYTPDRFGHLQKTVDTNGQTKTYRYKLQDISARHEIKITYTDGHNDWIRLAPGYYKDLSVNSDGKLCGLKR